MMSLKYKVLVPVNVNTAVFCDVTPCSLAEEIECLNVPEYSSRSWIIPFPEVVQWRRFSLVKFISCSRNNST
jgi:hypothetical protein